MCVRNVILLCSWLFTVPIVLGSEIAMDYYFGQAPLRSEDKHCKALITRLYCRAKCGAKPGLCLRGHCYCIEDVGNSANVETVPINKNLINSYRSNLRHHIAHFCENLDTARACIRKCMEEGKPAFCGKDHNCYCGHRYNANDGAEQKKDPKELYAEFQDLYEKYFGPNTDSGEDSKQKD